MLSILITAYRINHLKATIQSIIDQTYKDWDLFIYTPEERIRKRAAEILVKFGLNNNTHVFGDDDEGGKLFLKKISLKYIVPVNGGDLLTPSALRLTRDLIEKYNGNIRCIRAYRMEFESEKEEKVKSIYSNPDQDINGAYLKKQKKGRRLLFGFPLAINTGKYYCLHRDIIKRLDRGRIFEILDHDDPELWVNTGEAVWIDGILYLKRNGEIEGSGLSAKKSAEMWIKKKKLRLNVVSSDNTIFVENPHSPRSMDIEITNMCNGTCIFCPQKKLKTRDTWKRMYSIGSSIE